MALNSAFNLYRHTSQYVLVFVGMWYSIMSENIALAGTLRPHRPCTVNAIHQESDKQGNFDQALKQSTGIAVYMQLPYTCNRNYSLANNMSTCVNIQIKYKEIFD